VQGMLATLTASALTLANWFRTRWIRVRQVVGASKRWCAHWRRRRRKKALQARLMHRKSIWNVGAFVCPARFTENISLRKLQEKQQFLIFIVI